MVSRGTGVTGGGVTGGGVTGASVISGGVTTGSSVTGGGVGASPIWSAFHRKVTTCARVHAFSGPNLLLPTPPVTSFSTAHSTGLMYHALAATSEKLLPPCATAGFPCAAYRKVTTCARVQVLSGPKVVTEVPPVMPFSTAHSTGFKYHALLGTSLKGLFMDTGSGFPFAAHRKVTTCARVQGFSGPNKPSPTPPVILLSTAHFTGL